ncbi:MAG: glycosyltransferase [Alphaproteobacteria bacterium]
MVVAFAALSVAVWLYLVAFRGGFWRAGERLGPRLPAPSPWPGVVAVVPARNEAKTVAAALESLLAQDYPGFFSTILVDDASTDATIEIARRLAASVQAQGRLAVIAATPLPPGWTGKVWALHQGVARAAEVAPEARYVLLTDADIVHAPDTSRALVAKAEAERRDLVSLMVRLNCERIWERLLIPAFVFFFQKLHPFPYVNDERRPAAAAAGGCMLVRRETLQRVGGLGAVRGALIDDCALARAVKLSGGRLWLGLAETSRSLRTYNRLAELWAMVARTAYTQLRHSPLLLLATVVAMGVTYLAPPLVLAGLPAHGDDVAAVLATVAWALMAGAYAPTVAYYRQPRILAVLLPFAAALYLAMTVDSARRHWRGEGARWKGRHHSQGETGGG